MIKKTITYDDLDGNPVTEEYYFHMSSTELLELRLSEGGDLQARLRATAEKKDPGEMLKLIRWFIGLTVGQRSEDGKQFFKDPEFAMNFMASEAYGVLLMDLLQDPTRFAEFISGVVPKSMESKVQAAAQVEMQKELTSVSGEPTALVIASEPESQEKTFEEYTEDELFAMSDRAFHRLVGTKNPKEMTPNQMLIAFQRATGRIAE